MVNLETQCMFIGPFVCAKLDINMETMSLLVTMAKKHKFLY